MNACLLSAALLIPCSDPSSGIDGATREPVVIDFSPLPKDGTYCLFVRYRRRGVGGVVAERCTGLSPKDVRDLFKNRLASKGFVVKAVGETKLIVSDGQGKIELTSSTTHETANPKIIAGR